MATVTVTEYRVIPLTDGSYCLEIHRRPTDAPTTPESELVPRFYASSLREVGQMLASLPARIPEYGWWALCEKAAKGSSLMEGRRDAGEAGTCPDRRRVVMTISILGHQG